MVLDSDKELYAQQQQQNSSVWGGLLNTLGGLANTAAAVTTARLIEKNGASLPSAPSQVTDPNSTQVPKWVIPAAIGGVLLIVVVALTGGRRR